MLLQIFLLIVSTACDLLTVALLARFALQAMRAPLTTWRNPLGQFIQALTNWMVIPARRLIPSAFGYDTSSLLLAWFWQLAFLGLMSGLSGTTSVVALTPVLGVGAIAALETFKIAVYMTMGIVFASAIFSWVNPYAPMAAVVNQFAQPLLRPFQRIIPPIGGVDLSPLALLLALQVLLIVVGSLRTSLLPLLYGG